MTGFPFFRPCPAGLVRCLPLVLLLLLPAACVNKVPPAAPLPSQQALAAFTENQARLAAAPRDFLITGSAVLTRPDGFGGERVNRVTMEFWGRLENSADNSPLRLDVRAGVGAPLLNALQDKLGLLALAPQQNRAFTCRSPERLMRKLHLPLPFGLDGLAQLAYGPVTDFSPTDPRVRLDNLGRIVRIQDPAQGWKLEAEYPEAAPGQPAGLASLRPSRLLLRLNGSGSANVRIKSAGPSPLRWNQNALDLKLPPNVTVSPCQEAAP